MHKKMILVVALLLAVVLALPMMVAHVGEAAERELTESVVFQIGTAAYFADNQVPGVEMDVAPFIRDGHTLVPLRFLANALGVDSDNISWNNPVVTLSQPGFPVVKLTIGEKFIDVDGESTATDIAPLLQDGRVMLPAKFVAEALGYQVDWQPEAQLVVAWPKDAAQPEIGKVLRYLKIVEYYERPENLTACAEMAWAELLRGNKRFLQGDKVIRDWAGLKEHHEVGQWPFVSIVSCSDSRFAPEVVFDQGIGDVFIVRTAGNTVAELALGSLEFSINVLGTPLIVVLGHEGCGAVYATVDAKEGVLVLPEGFAPDKLLSVVGEVMPAAEKAAATTEKTGIELREYATRLNTIFVAQEILNDASGIKDAVAQGEVTVIGAKSMFAGNVVELFRVTSDNLSQFMEKPGCAGGCGCCS